jgi:hypothetical protein
MKNANAESIWTSNVRCKSCDRYLYSASQTPSSTLLNILQSFNLSSPKAHFNMAVFNMNQSDEPKILTAVRLIRIYWPLLIPLVFTLRFLYYRYASPLRTYPGPFLASGSRAWKVLSTYSGKTETGHIKIHERYGPIVRIAPNELSFASPSAAKEVLAAGKGFQKTDFYGVFPPPENPDIFTETREAVHGVKKRYASHAYSMGVMQSMAGRIEETERLLCRKLDAICASADQYCNLGDYLHFFAFDVLGEIAFSRKFGFLEAVRILFVDPIIISDNG